MTEQTKKVATKLNPLLHAEFIRATRLNNETMNSALRRLANRYTEETKSELLRSSVGSIKDGSRDSQFGSRE